MGPIVEYAQLYIYIYIYIYKENKKLCGFSQRCVPPLSMPKICFDGFAPERTKSTGIGECAGMIRNFSIFKLKLCRNLISTQAKLDSLIPLTVPYNLSGKYFENWTELKGKRQVVWTSLKDNKFRCRLRLKMKH